jgi:hypothetical protein
MEGQKGCEERNHSPHIFCAMCTYPKPAVSQLCALCTGPCSGHERALMAGGHPSRTPPAPPTTPCMQQRHTNMQGRHSSPSADCPTSITHARKSCNFEPCITALAPQIMRFCPASATRRRAHLFANPLSWRQRRAGARQGERRRVIGLHGQPGGRCASAVVRARAQAPAHLPFGPATSPWRPPAWKRPRSGQAWIGCG